MSPRLLALSLVLAVTGCGELSRSATINARLTAGESMFVGVEVHTSATGAALEVDWSVELLSFGGAACPVAVYRWLDELPERGELPIHDPLEGWPRSWDGGELVESVVVPASEAVELGPQRLDEARDRVGGLLGIATCEGSALDAIVHVEAEAELGVRAVYDALLIDLWRAG
ncbi:MAG: hypothetical protein R6X02_33895 [Enhygromyxa sp.]